MNSSKEVTKWLEEQLSAILSFPLPQDMIEYIVAIENERDIEDYLRTLLDLTNPTHQQFCDNYINLRTNGSRSRGAAKNNKSQKDDLKLNIDKLSMQDTKKSSSKQSSAAGKKKKKDKFVSLYSDEGAGRDVVLLKGRHCCDCQAAKHRLINNCTSCGRIVCEQEGSGPCIFCGKLVCTKTEQDFINAQSQKSKKLRDSLMEAGRPEGWENAVAHRDRLLEFDRTTQRRTRVIDDEGEYYSANAVWLSQEEKVKQMQVEQAREQRKHASRLATKFTLDFAGRQVKEDVVEENIEWNAESESSFDFKSTPSVAPNIELDWQPQYMATNNKSHDDSGKKPTSKVISAVGSRVQDKELLEMSDTGACLSLHQPWASLVVCGIKKHEGRTWYTPHRGRLWIAAAAKVPSDDVISETEQYYRQLLHGESLTFPDHYPTSCLLGCVNLVDCIPQEEYQARYSLQESDSPFVFICEKAQSLKLKFPISGKHKIYQLEKPIHTAAQKMLMRMPQ